MDEAYGHHHHHKRQARGQAAHPTWAVRGSERVNGLRRPKVTFNADFASADAQDALNDSKTKARAGDAAMIRT